MPYQQAELGIMLCLLGTSPKLSAYTLRTPDAMRLAKSIIRSNCANSASQRQQQRFSAKGLNKHIMLNSMMTSAQIKRLVHLNSESVDLLQHTIEKLNLSARLVHRTIKVARTIADLEECDEVGVSHLSEALQLRCAV